MHFIILLLSFLCFTPLASAAALQERFNGIHDRLCQPDGRVRGSVLVLVNDEDIRFLDKLQTPVNEGDEVAILPAVAGG